MLGLKTKTLAKGQTRVDVGWLSPDSQEAIARKGGGGSDMRWIWPVANTCEYLARLTARVTIELVRGSKGAER